MACECVLQLTLFVTVVALAVPNIRPAITANHIVTPGIHISVYIKHTIGARRAQARITSQTTIAVSSILDMYLSLTASDLGDRLRR